ncbi:unnamed protein product, partial [Symbiodinium sp. KB8]
CPVDRSGSVAWADALPALHARLPRSAASYVQLLEAELGEATHCLGEAANARRLLLDRGWSHCPTWRAILEGACPTFAANPGAGDWPHGWQYHAFRTLTEHSRERLSLRPQPGCGEMVDALGDHALACPRTGLLARRGKIVERAWVRVAREAVDVASDFDLVVYGATAHGGVLCCDATFVSPLTRTGHPQPCTVEVDGAMLKVAERRKRSTYPELARGPQRLLVLGSEIGGRRQPPAGRDAGGALFPSRSSSPSPVPRLAAMASWSTAGAK